MPTTSPHPQPYIAARIQKLRAALQASRLPAKTAYLITNFPDVSWLTGFEGDDSFALLTADRLLLLSDSRYTEQIARECPWITAVIRQKSILEEVAKQAKRLNLHTLAVQSESLTLKAQSDLLRHLKDARLKLKILPLSDLIIKLRHIKDNHEIAIIEQAIRISQDAFLALKSTLKPGQTENDIAGLLGYEMRRRGALNSSFDSIIAVGPNSSLPHYRPGDVRLAHNSSLLLDWGARYKGYCADLTRMLFLGAIAPKMREIYKIVLEAQLAAIAAIKPGVHGKKVDKVARDLITRAGYGDQFGHGTGHGLGRDIHEPIALSRLSTTILEPGMIITVEPGIYLPGLGGVRIEDDILVTPAGHRVLSSLPKDLMAAAL